MTETENFVDLHNNIFSSEGALKLLRYADLNHKFDVYLLNNGKIFIKYDTGNERKDYVIKLDRFIYWLYDEDKTKIIWTYML